MYLVDTNVVSEARRGASAAVGWLTSVDPFAIHLSVITIGEIRRGIVRKQARDGRPPVSIMTWLETLRQVYADRILPIDERVAWEWGRIGALRTRGDADGLIAATAIVHDFTLVTRNRADFEDTGARVIDPWSMI